MNSDNTIVALPKEIVSWQDEFWESLDTVASAAAFDHNTASSIDEELIQLVLDNPPESSATNPHLARSATNSV